MGGAFSTTNSMPLGGGENVLVEPDVTWRGSEEVLTGMTGR